jgi:hypothetical protein
MAVLEQILASKRAELPGLRARKSPCSSGRAEAARQPAAPSHLRDQAQIAFSGSTLLSAFSRRAGTDLRAERRVHD